MVRFVSEHKGLYIELGILLIPKKAPDRTPFHLHLEVLGFVLHEQSEEVDGLRVVAELFEFKCINHEDSGIFTDYPDRILARFESTQQHGFLVECLACVNSHYPVVLYLVLVNGLIKRLQVTVVQISQVMRLTIIHLSLMQQLRVEQTLRDRFAWADQAGAVSFHDIVLTLQSVVTATKDFVGEVFDADVLVVDECLVLAFVK